jgi:glycerophosphoryl diester phosphodiesterase
MEKVFSKKSILNKRIFEQEEENDEVKVDTDNGKENGSFTTLVSGLLHSRTQIHIYHLQTKSFAVHKALNKFYDEVVDLFDGLVESYQGKHGIIENYKCDGYDDYTSVESVIQYLQKLDKTIESSRKSVKESFIQNQIDTVQELIYSTIYKLKFLK